MAVDFTLALQKIIDMMNGIIEQLPNMVIGVVIFFIFYILSDWIKTGVQKVASASGRSSNAGLVFGRLARYGTLIGGVLVALVVVLPNFRPTTLLGGLGISSVAIGFAFRDILQNFLAGLLILMTDPFRIGDQIIVNDFEGTVEDIQTRSTTLLTYDGRRVVIPNADLFTDSVIVNTAADKRRSEYDVGIGYGEDIETARAVVLDAVKGIEGVYQTPEPEVLMVDMASSSVNLRVHWWTDSARDVVMQVKDQVLTEIKNQLDVHGIEIPFPTRTLFLAHETENRDHDAYVNGWLMAHENMTNKLVTVGD